MRLFDGPGDAPATLLLAHGAGAPMDSPFMASIDSVLGLKGLRVVRFEFAYMARMRETGRRQGPDRMPVLQEVFRQQVQLEKEAWPDRPLFVGGNSMGVGSPACWWMGWPPVAGLKAVSVWAIPSTRRASP